MSSILRASANLFFSPRTEMTEENLKWLENVFRRTVGENGEIRLQDFKNIVHSKNVSWLGYFSISFLLLPGAKLRHKK